MAENSKIEWTNHTFNGWRGCEHATLPDGTPHPGCTHCYAEAMAPRNPSVLGKWGGDGVRVPLQTADQAGVRVRGTDDYWQLPLKWNRQAEKAGARARVFALSLGDVFEDWRGPILDAKGQRCCFYEPKQGWLTTPAYMEKPPQGARFATMDDLRRELFRVIDHTPWLDWILLTKRPENVTQMWPVVPGHPDDIAPGGDGQTLSYYRQNVWLLTSISDQNSANQLVPLLLDCRSLVSVVGLSIEPLLGPIDLRAVPYQDGNCLFVGESGGWEYAGSPRQFLGWAIVGGESGHHARPMHPQWARDLRDQCGDGRVPFFFKQWGSYFEVGKPTDADEVVQVGARSDVWVNLDGSTGEHKDWNAVGMSKVGNKKDAGRVLDGRTWDEFPSTVPK